METRLKLSIVIPVRDEAHNLPPLLAQLAPLRARGAEVIVVDGGSRDGSTELAAQAGVLVLRSPPGRARQMNAGAARAGGSALLFLHADTRLPPAADRLVGDALQAGRGVWGRFDVRIEGRPRMLRVVAGMMNVRSRLTGIATGDQAMFMTRAAFDAVGGFPELPLMEDVELSRRLKTLSAPLCLRPPALTSGRRWERHGVWRTIVLMWRLRWAWWRGAPAAELAARYRGSAQE
jgi:rSAM/selenodomain-associated transferase 2